MKKLFTSIEKKLLIVIIALIYGQSSMAQFVPGEGGSLPAFTPFTSLPGKIGALIITSSDRENNTFYTGTRALVEMSFPEPTVFGATSYTLQYSADNGSTWGNYQLNGVDATSTYNNFSMNFDANYLFRLLVNGGPKNGYTSNEVYAPLSGIDTKFMGWSIDQSMFLTGVMSPYIGSGINTSFTVKKLVDYSIVDGNLTYQWYRVNPATYEMTAIPSATSLNYITTPADAGYKLLIKATGDGVNVGGFMQLLASSRNVFPNKVFISDVTGSGFKLNLYKTVAGLTPTDLILVDNTSQQIPINSVTQGLNAAIYDVSATLDPAKVPYYLISTSNFWSIVSSMFGDFMVVEGVSFGLATEMKEIIENTVKVYPIPVVNTIHFNAGIQIYRAEIITSNGATVVQSVVNSKVGTLSTNNLRTGIYFLRLTTSEGVVIKKIEIKH